MTLVKREYTAFVIQHDGGYYVRLLSGRYQVAELGDNLTSELDLATVFDDEATVARVVKIDHDKTDRLYSYLTLRTDRELTTELNEWFCSGKHTAPFSAGTLLYWGRKP